MECFNNFLMGSTCKSIDDNDAENDLNCGDHDISEENNFDTLPRDQFCDILEKNAAAFSPSPESLPCLCPCPKSFVLV